MKNTKSYKPLLYLLLAGWCLLFLRCESTEKSMVRAVYLAQTEQGYQAGLLYQAPQAAAVRPQPRRSTSCSYSVNNDSSAFGSSR